MLQAWSQVGYQVYWQANLNLQDVLPCARPRALLVLVHKDCQPPLELQCHSWSSARRASLHDAAAIFDHPPALQAALTLSPEELAVYMDPWYMPASRSTASRLRPESFRLRTPHQSAGCFLPQYQSQHHLSEQVLSRQGLLGVLLHHDGQVRFFSGAEIGSLHGATKPLLLPANSQVQMKLLGGSTAVPQAITCLVHACRALQVAVPAPDEAVNLVLQHRLRNDNTLFLPLGQDWILCRKDQVQEVLQTGLNFLQAPLPERSPWEFVQVTLHFDQGHLPLQVPAGLSPRHLLQHIGVGGASPQDRLPPMLAHRTEAMTIQVPDKPFLNCGGFLGASSDTNLCTVSTAKGLYLVDPHSPRLWPQLLNIFDDLSELQEDLILYSVSGQRLWYAEDFEGCLVAEALARDAPEIPIQSAFRATEGHVMTILCPEPQAVDYWLGFPFHLTEALGWNSEVANYPCPPGQTMQLTLQPNSCRVCLSPAQLPSQLRIWYVVACLEASKVQGDRVLGFEVEVQVVARRIWQGRLPGHFVIDSLEDWWRQASESTGTPPDARIFSGPHPLAHQTALETACQNVKGVVIRKSGALLLTVHPSCTGGGVKEETLTGLRPNLHRCASAVALTCEPPRGLWTRLRGRPAQANCSRPSRSVMRRSGGIKLQISLEEPRFRCRCAPIKSLKLRSEPTNLWVEKSRKLRPGSVLLTFRLHKTSFRTKMARQPLSLRAYDQVLRGCCSLMPPGRLICYIP